MVESAMQNYRKLPCKGDVRRLLWRTSCTLWEGPDHFLMIGNNYFTERYRRFYFKDIQSITLQRKRSYPFVLIGLLVFGLLPFLPILIYGADLSDSMRRGLYIVATGIFMGFFGVFLLHLFKGPTCRCRFQTAVQTEEIGAINRIKTARKVLPMIVGRIESIQGKVKITQEATGGGIAIQPPQ